MFLVKIYLKNKNPKSTLSIFCVDFNQKHIICRDLGLKSRLKSTQIPTQGASWQPWERKGAVVNCGCVCGGVRVLTDVPATPRSFVLPSLCVVLSNVRKNLLPTDTIGRRFFPYVLFCRMSLCSSKSKAIHVAICSGAPPSQRRATASQTRTTMVET